MSRHLASGPDGGNLLGFLAAVGALQTLDRAFPDANPRMWWVRSDLAWRPTYEVSGTTSDDALVAAMHGVLAADGTPEFSELGDNLSVDPERFRDVATRAAATATPSRRRYVDYLAAYGCELPTTAGAIQDTGLRTMSGAGHQHFLKSMRDLVRLTTESDLYAALFAHWRYADGTPTMRWDPADDRRYALRADDPAKSTQAPIRTVRGANRLAIEALPFFAVMPSEPVSATTGFAAASGRRSRAAVRWPIWTVPWTVDAVKVAVTQAPVAASTLDASVLTALGVVQVYESRRQTVGKMRSFAPAAPVVVER